MYEVGGLKSLGLFVGTGECNARCAHCAGVVHRKYAPLEDGVVDEDLILQTVGDCYTRGARSLSLSSSGEPTLSPLSVTKVLELVDSLEGVEFSPINLYSNGIRIGGDREFCDEYLGRWKDLGLEMIYITVHDTDGGKNAASYGVESYPSLDLVLDRIHGADLLVRANLVLSRENIGTLERFASVVGDLRDKGFDRVSAWPIRGDDDEIDLDLSPSEDELDAMSGWINGQKFDDVILYRDGDRVLYETAQKLTLFPDGTLSSSWCNR
jgi:MoaA/NifB/PqqE/SkfB family radical SAM enzyme